MRDSIARCVQSSCHPLRQSLPRVTTAVILGVPRSALAQVPRWIRILGLLRADVVVDQGERRPRDRAGKAGVPEVAQWSLPHGGVGLRLTGRPPRRRPSGDMRLRAERKTSPVPPPAVHDVAPPERVGWVPVGPAAEHPVTEYLCRELMVLVIGAPLDHRNSPRLRSSRSASHLAGVT